MLAPLLFGTGILLRSIRTNASLIFPRIGLVVVLLWMLWFANSVVQNTVVYLRRQVCASFAPIVLLQCIKIFLQGSKFVHIVANNMFHCQAWVKL
jgi:hypothetical protein